MYIITATDFVGSINPYCHSVFRTGVSPSYFTVVQKKQLVDKETYHQLIAESLYNLGVDGILRRCVLEHEINMVISETHEGVAVGHYAGKEKTQNIMCTGLW
jgi:hypothetical protein